MFHKEKSKKSFFNADSRKSNADSRRFIYGNICGILRYICEHLRSRKIFSKLNLEITRKILFFLSFIVILGLLQTAFSDYVKVFNGKGDLLIISVFTCSLFFKLRWAVFLSIFAGLLKDTLSLNSFGINTLLFPLWSILIIRLSKAMPLDNNFIRALCVFTCVAVNDTIAIVILLFSGVPAYWGIFFRTVFIDSLYTALTLPVVFRALRPALYAHKNL